MKRIVKDSKDDHERHQKRKETFKKNKLKKRTPKQRIPKVEYNSEEHYEANRNNISKAPYYDPHECHVHKWKKGTIPCKENSKSKYFLYEKFRKEYTGNYCSICHETRKFISNCSSNEKCLINRRQNIIDAMNNYVISEGLEVDDCELIVSKKTKHEQLFIPQCISNNQISEYKYKFAGIMLDNDCENEEDNADTQEEFIFVEGTSSNKFITEKDLFISGTDCKISLQDCKNGKIVKESFPLIVVKDDKGVEHKLNGNKVFPYYVTENQRLVPVKTPPKRVHLRKDITMINDKNGVRMWFTDKSVVWDQTWNNYMSWRKFHTFLKKYLPKEVVYYQTFGEHDHYDKEKQSKLKINHDWNCNKKGIDYEFFKGSSRPKFFMPLEYVVGQTEYYKFLRRDQDPNAKMIVI
jgi:hypothetical protein